MIKLNKAECPAVLQENATAWTEAIIQKIANGEELTATEKYRYRHADIKQALVDETHGKCAYCESKLRHITYGDVEHIIPKKVDPNLCYAWANLTLACDICNTEKGIREDIIDPYSEDPDDHLQFLGPYYFPKPESDLGLISEDALKLNRAELNERRTDVLRSTLKIIKLIGISSPEAAEVLKTDLIEKGCASQAEYSACVREFVKKWGLLD